jgi:23S rRNA (cytidine1920-2'-O)/16S rRNA (cytidine1409-2'-O)-methyltransferase
MKQRADLLLVERGLFESRKRAQDAIAAGLVRANGRPVQKASETLSQDAAIEASAPHPWVSRGGVKLDAALTHFRFEATGKICLDIGTSTGGFADVLLSRHAARVYAVDVGHGQLHPRLAGHPRIVSMEGCDARELTSAHLPEPPQLITCDVSFISLKLVLPHISALTAPAADIVCLIKPQFEAGRSHVAKGIVTDPAVHAAVCADIEKFLGDLGWCIRGLLPSPLLGGDGNREFLIGATRP